MNVSIKDFDVDMKIKNNGIELEVYGNNEEHLGDLYVTKTKLIWCKGKTSRANGKEIKWQAFMDYMDGQ